MEELKDINGFENKYQVSTKGYVISLNYNNTGYNKILKTKVNKQGHLEVTLNKEDKHYYRLLSRLVYETFTGNKLNKNDVLMYKDQDKTNCSLDNLYLITRGERQEITYDKGNRKTDKLGREYLKEYEFYGEMLNVKQLSRKLGINKDTIRDRMRELRWNVYEASEIPVAKYGKRGKNERN